MDKDRLKGRPVTVNPDKLAVKMPSVSWYFENSEDFLERYLANQEQVKEATQDVMGMDQSAWRELGRKSYEQNPSEREELQETCYDIYFKNPIAGNIIDNYMFYSVGKEGVEVNWEGEGRKEAKKRWEKLKKRNLWESLSKDIARMTFLAGENFVGIFPRQKPVKMDMRQFHPINVPDVNLQQGDNKSVESFRVENTKDEIWEERNMTHFKVRDVGPVNRGRPILERVIEALTWYHSFLEDRVNMMRARSRMPIIRYVEGEPEGVPVKSLPEPNTVLDESKSNEWKFPELNMSSYDIAKDAREMKLYIATGVSLPEYMTYFDASNANYSSTIVTESTPIALFKHMQGKLRPMYKDLVRKIMPGYEDVDLSISFPEVDLRNFDKKVEAVIKEFKNNLRSKKSAQEALDLDPDKEEERMEGTSDEELKNLTESVLFHSPAINQSRRTGSKMEKLVDAFEERGWLQ